MRQPHSRISCTISIKDKEMANLRVHITNIYGMHHTETALKAQNRVADVARESLNYNELGVYCYDINSDSPKMLSARLDGIIASVGFGDIVILQFPTWNDFKFDEALLNRLKLYRGLKIITFAHDMPPLMFENNRYFLGRYIEFLNRTDLVILPSQRMADFLYSEGLTVKKTIIQKIWDFPVTIDQSVRPKFGKVINFAGRASSEKSKWAFLREWNYDAVELRITADREDWALGKNISFLGWFKDDTLMVNAFRNSGGFGLVWSEDTYFREYMKLNANYKLSAYLAAGIPLIVNSCIAEKDTIVRKNLGLVVDSLDEAVERVSNMGREEYDKMVADVAVFSELVRQSYFTKKVLTDAVFKLLYD